MKTIVKVNNLTKFYGKNKVLSNVTLKIQEKRDCRFNWSQWRWEINTYEVFDKLGIFSRSGN